MRYTLIHDQGPSYSIHESIVAGSRSVAGAEKALPLQGFLHICGECEEQRQFQAK